MARLIRRLPLVLLLVSPVLALARTAGAEPEPPDYCVFVGHEPEWGGMEVCTPW